MLLSTTYFDGFNSILHVWENLEVSILRFCGSREISSPTFIPFADKSSLFSA